VEELNATLPEHFTYSRSAVVDLNKHVELLKTGVRDTDWQVRVSSLQETTIVPSAWPTTGEFGLALKPWAKTFFRLEMSGGNEPFNLDVGFSLVSNENYTRSVSC
jgi:hypothetical protein